MKMERNIGSLKDSYMVLAASQQYILLRSKTENPRPSYAVARIDGDGRAFDLQARVDREAAERLFCSLCFPGWFK
ncbi:hypothetical protein WMO24_15680 [Ruthenibacterium sp. CLA-JM-H11]|uniref:Uncharacterized protein n=1 Tax=Ruthenibacterium intestinale TaxID=3133163 RepID=A0ABV1GJ27_9FIRM